MTSPISRHADGEPFTERYIRPFLNKAKDVVENLYQGKEKAIPEAIGLMLKLKGEKLNPSYARDEALYSATNPFYRRWRDKRLEETYRELLNTLAEVVEKNEGLQQKLQKEVKTLEGELDAYSKEQKSYNRDVLFGLLTLPISIPTVASAILGSWTPNPLNIALLGFSFYFLFRLSRGLWGWMVREERPTVINSYKNEVVEDLKRVAG